jgi:hypothetical protein
MRRFRAYVGHHHLALIALFVALGGTGYAAIRLPAGSVGTRQIKNRAVTLPKIATSARAALHGSNGRTGAPGQNGKEGPAGRNGAAIVARAKASSFSVAANTNVEVPVPVSAGSWQQEGGEVDQFVGQATYTPPASCGSNGAVTLNLYVGGNQLVGGFTAQPHPGQGVQRLQLKFDAPLYDSNTPTARTLTAKATNTCSGANEDATIDTAQIYVIAAR